MTSNFSGLGLPGDLVTALAKRGFETPFPVQELALPPALAGRDICGKAPTGSGKTLAFGLPLAVRVGKAKPRRPRALVLAPTRELASQIHAELKPLLALRGRTSATFFGGVGFGPQLSALRKGTDVAIACPGRLSDLVRRGEIHLDSVEIVVVDEADRMADMGFMPEVRRILDAVRPDRQTLLFSATLDGEVDELVRRYQRDPELCDVSTGEEDTDRNEHRFVPAKRENRISMAADIIAEHGPTVVFCRTKHGVDRVARQLSKAGVSAVSIHGGRSQNQRARALAQFTRGSAQALVATDVAARGIHVEGVACVIHFDLAGDHKDYLHRSGRTGRAGSAGTVISFVTDTDKAKARSLEAAIGGERAEPAPRPQQRRRPKQANRRRGRPRGRAKASAR